MGLLKKHTVYCWKFSKENWNIEEDDDLSVNIWQFVSIGSSIFLFTKSTSKDNK